MKTPNLQTAVVAIIAATSLASICTAQPPPPPPPVAPPPPGVVMSRGTITEFVPGKTFIVKESAGPVTYYYGPTVTYVTRKGKVIPAGEIERRIRAGVPVSVGYVSEGERRVINKVEVDIDDD